MTRYGFVCLLLAAMAWGQATNTKPASSSPAAAGQSSAAKAAPAAQPAAQVAPDAPVITIKGLCDQSLGKSPALECRTQITRAQFEKIMDAIQPNMPLRARRQFAMRYANILVMSDKAEKMGLDKGADFQEHMKLARMQVLATELNKEMQEKASDISDKDIEDYYKSNPDKFEEAEMQRIYVPKAQQEPEEQAEDQEKDKDKKPLSPEEQEKQMKAREEVMQKEAEKLHTAAAAGGDFNKLQGEAYEAAGIKSNAPNTDMGKMRRNMLPPTQVSAMDMKPGEVSPLISDQSGYFIYKLVSKDTMPLDQAREEIKGTLRSEHLQNEMKQLQDSSTPTLDEAYFGPEGPMRGMGGPGMPPPPGRPGPPPGPK